MLSFNYIHFTYLTIYWSRSHYTFTSLPCQSHSTSFPLLLVLLSWGLSFPSLLLFCFCCGSFFWSLRRLPRILILLLCFCFLTLLGRGRVRGKSKSGWRYAVSWDALKPSGGVKPTYPQLLSSIINGKNPSTTLHNWRAKVSFSYKVIYGRLVLGWLQDQNLTEIQFMGTGDRK